MNQLWINQSNTAWCWLEPWTGLWLSIQLGMEKSSQLTFTPSFFRGVGRYTTNQIMIKHESTNQIWIQLGFLHLRTAFLNFPIRCSPFFSSFESRHSQRLAETKGSTWPGFEGEAILKKPRCSKSFSRGTINDQWRISWDQWGRNQWRFLAGKTNDSRPGSHVRKIHRK